jgi:outer membrane protease
MQWTARMKKILFFSVWATWLCAALYAIDFAFETTGGIVAGATREYVYEGDKCVSRLDWRDAAVPAMFFSGQAALRGAFLRLEILSALNLISRDKRGKPISKQRSE